MYFDHYFRRLSHFVADMEITAIYVMHIASKISKYQLLLKQLTIKDLNIYKTPIHFIKTYNITSIFKENLKYGTSMNYIANSY